ncbi:TPA: fimbria/pilus periplasmic chaperone [Citrobacter koseri]
MFALLPTAGTAYAAISLDRTRVIYNGTEKSVSMNISNENKQLPYLAQGWIETEKGEKITSPLTVLPPVQRIEPGAKSQIKVQALSVVSALPQDRESLFYFNLREIPPKSSKPNTLQIALQTRIKLFYRPAAIELNRTDAGNSSVQEKLTLSKQGNNYTVNNPTPYYITLVGARASVKGSPISGFKPVMVPPKGQSPLGMGADIIGASPVLTAINDYGGRPDLQFTCSGANCTAGIVKK